MSMPKEGMSMGETPMADAPKQRADINRLHYHPPADGWDEMKTANGQIRAHWRGFIEQFRTLDPGEMARRWDVGQALLRDNGVTYNLHGDSAGLDRPWQLDPFPMILSWTEWSALAKGIAQRARAIDAVLADLYGPRTLVSKGIIPPALLHANPGFLRPCHGWTPEGGHHLTLYAADLVRGPDGHWRVYADRTESPAGTGYALENRTIVGRTLSESLRTIHVERLAPFFDAKTRALKAASPRRSDEPRVVLLTPGPYNETYFEHAYLARHLGVTLVQGEDLTARDNHIYLKTLTGLQQVDVILRHMSGEWCDPLDLRGDSMLGVAGLVQAARAGNVAIVNALGSGLFDGSALSAFLPEANRALFKTDLLLPSVETLWCGNAADRDKVLDGMDDLFLRPAFRNRTQAAMGSGLGQSERTALRETIMARPWEWVSQAVQRFSTVPVWQAGKLTPQAVMLRVFAVAKSPTEWEVMPGGLARVAPDYASLAIGRLQTGGGSKDLWILAREDQHTSSIDARTQSAPVKLVRGSRDLPSRVADNMFWLGRYLERCDSLARLLRAAVRGIDDGLDQGDSETARKHAKTLQRMGLTFPGGAFTGPPERLSKVLMEFHLGKHANGLAHQVERMSRVAANLRDRLSIDTWRVLQQLRDKIDAAGPKSRAVRDDVDGWLNGIILMVEAANGLSMENMTRGPLWQFMDSGRRIERAIFLVDALWGALTGCAQEQDVPMDVLLDIADSIMTYRSRYLAAPRLAGVIDLLMCDESNPRSLGFQLAALSAHMDSLSSQRKDEFLSPEQRLMTVLCGIVRTLDVSLLATTTGSDGFIDMEHMMETCSSRLWELSEIISREYFTHAQWRLPTRPPDLLP
jgi:uncharacterized circularly permuted ATP-grasp superfamily protein/uncharacterized alpha-E superfamily protein